MVFKFDVRKTVACGKAELAGSWVRESEWEERGTDHMDRHSNLLPPQLGWPSSFPGKADAL